ncbi:methyltransferase domain-containing protein [Nocardioides donggukensis]|uniref:Class I SAM-dependent methyltransferase n=1 Tax=Nocardioides donggukensis TaxID=2774019 RepID=A0A927K5A4_9ACTN|nr:class I SAM-dependent methyltransferase [Nocardioides donggukensis]MBD8870063.1 class I SAM-dependent methyltransferase [Nocardioides donggukensis]
MNPRSDGRDGRPRETWSTYQRSIGDRSGLFAALARGWSPERALYPGSYLDLSPSTAIPSVTYVDTDRRAARFLTDRDAVRAELEGRALPGAGLEVEFLHADYTHELELSPSSFDLLISLYAGPVWEHCGRYLRPGGLLLANTSHGDASLAALDPRLELVAVVQHRAGRYRLDDEDLGGHLVPKRPEAADPETIRRSGRGIAYTRTAFGYLFRCG